MSSKRIIQWVVSTLAIWALTILAVLKVGDLGLLPWGDRFGLGQFAIEFLLVPPVVIGFIVALVELRALSSRAEPRLFLEIANKFSKSFAFSLPEEDQTKYREFTIAVINEGNSVSEWWSFWISIPDYLFEEVGYRKRWGTRVKNGEWDSKHRGGYRIHEFYSLGQVAIYPDRPRSLASFVINTDTLVAGDEIEIHYHFFTNRGKPISDSISILVRETGEEEVVGAVFIDE